jgi:hypothetical protein
MRQSKENIMTKSFKVITPIEGFTAGVRYPAYAEGLLVVELKSNDGILTSVARGSLKEDPVEPEKVVCNHVIEHAGHWRDHGAFDSSRLSEPDYNVPQHVWERGYTEQTFVDTGLHSYKCTQCQQVFYYSERGRALELAAIIAVGVPEPTPICGFKVTIDDHIAGMLESGTAWVEIKLTGKGDQLGLYVEDTLVFWTDDLHTYTRCAEALITYMNSY